MADQWNGLLGDEGEALYRAAGAVKTKAISLVAEAQGEVGDLKFQIKALTLRAERQESAHKAEIDKLHQTIAALKG